MIYIATWETLNFFINTCDKVTYGDPAATLRRPVVQSRWHLALQITILTSTFWHIVHNSNKQGRGDLSVRRCLLDS